MSKKKHSRIPHKFLPWIDARKKYRLSHAHIQMARELGLNPKRFGGMASTQQQPWKLPFPQFIESLYEAKFGKTAPDVVQSIEEMAAEHMAKRAARKAEKSAAEAASESEPSEAVAPEAPIGE